MHGVPTRDERIYYEYDISLANGNARFRCHNTAWLSELREKAGALKYFVRPREDLSPADVSLSLLHHPYNWFTPDLLRPNRDSIEGNSDIILTGHEHESDARESGPLGGESNLYIEGGALQTSDPDESTFNILLIDPSRQEQLLHRFEWDPAGRLYRNTTPNAVWRSYNTRRLSNSRAFSISQEFRSILEAPGMDLSHPARGQLKLSDIFVYPDLRKVAYPPTPTPQIFGADLLPRTLVGKPRLIIAGAEQAGKTALAKRLFSDLHERGFVPLFVDAAQFRFKGTEQDQRSLLRLLEDQYDAPDNDRYLQLPRDERVLLVDNSHGLVRDGGIRKALQFAMEFAGAIILFASELAQLVAEATGQGSQEDSLGFEYYSIQTFGHLKRAQLIDKWFALDPNPPPTLTAKQLHQTKQTIDSIIGKNFVPARPFVLLPLLQAQSHEQPIDIRASTSGYFYELLIRRALAKNQNSRIYDVLLNYLAHIAFAMFEQGATQISEFDLHELHSKYCSDYNVELGFTDVLAELEKRAVLQKTPQAGWAFKFDYYRYYFTALRLRDALTSGDETLDARRSIERTCRSLHEEESANVMLFLAHLARHPAVLSNMVASADELFADAPVADLSAHSFSFLGELTSIVEGLAFEERPNHLAREQTYRKLDEIDLQEPSPEATRGPTPARGEEPDASSEDLKETYRRYSVGFKTLQILGQIAKNFPGTLKADEKHRILVSCHRLGLRLLGSFLEGISREKDQFVADLADLVRREEPHLAASVLEKKVSRSLHGLLHMLGLVAVRATAQSVGAFELTKANDRVLKEIDTDAVALVHLATGLDQAALPFPIEEIQQLSERLRDNVFAADILKSIVVNHFYLFEEQREVRQRVCELLGIPYKNLQRPPPLARLVSRT